MKVAANNLLSSLDESQMSREERRAIEQTPLELQQRYDALRLMMSERRVQYTSFLSVLRIRDPGWLKKIKNRIQDKHSGSYFRELINNCSTRIRIRDPESC